MNNDQWTTEVLRLAQDRNITDEVANFIKGRFYYEAFTPEEFVLAYEACRFSTSGSDEVQKSKTRGCYYCLKIFDAKVTTEDSDLLCPYCGTDSVIPDSLCPVTPEVLAKARLLWFSRVDDWQVDPQASKG